MRTVINFRHLEAIRAVMMSGSVTGAGERLHVTRSAISHRQRAAEARLAYGHQQAKSTALWQKTPRGNPK